MIDINDYNREDLIASCLMEAAQVMSESAGSSGYAHRTFQEKQKKYTKMYNDSKKALENKADNFSDMSMNDKLRHVANRAGNKIKNMHAKKELAINKIVLANSDTHRTDLTLDQKKHIAKLSKDLLNDTRIRHIPKKTNYDLHQKINERARKAMGESAYDHLDFADALLDVIDNE